jgi:hypothetical protein
MDKIIKKAKDKKLTMVDFKHIEWLVKYVSQIKGGKMVELGVAKGGVLALCSRANPNLEVIGMDSWKGMPPITKEDQQEHKKYEGVAWATKEDVIRSYCILRAPQEKLTLIKGFFEQTIPKNMDKLKEITILRIDCDWYVAVKYVLQQLYSKVVKGGLIIIDDYHWNTGCKKAVDEFLPNLKYQQHYPNSFGPIYFFKQ